MSNACVMRIFDDDTFQYFGHANPKIIGNIFRNLTGTAFLMVTETSGTSQPIFLNNTLVNCRTGVDSQQPWDARIQGNIFVGATNAVKTSGALSRTVSYNCFYGNATNFTGYPGTYGLPIIANRNGTSCDLLYNIFQDPQFLATNDFHLAANSPCIDAGTPDWAFTDMCFPPSRGTSFPDQGAYGGPDACNWLDAVPLLPVTLTASWTNRMGTLSWGALPRSTYRLQFLTNLVSVGTNAWIDWIDVLATDKPTSITDPVARPETYVRVKSLGRAPGN